MRNKIFVSYKYGDNNVENIIGTKGKGGLCTVRDYVDELEKTLKNKTEHIYKGESDGEDLSQLSDDTIWEKLKNRIYDSTLTIVMLSKGMREKYKAEKHQWIPQEISYSLKEISRIDSSGNSVTSKTNALIAVIIPDIYGNYDYFTYQKDCCNQKCIHYNNESDRIFTIMSKNMLIRKVLIKSNATTTITYIMENAIICFVLNGMILLITLINILIGHIQSKITRMSMI